MKDMKIKKLNLKLRTRTKVLIPLLIAFILLRSAIPIADIKLGTDGSGDSWFGAIGVITNSNGKYWNATWSNIQLAVDDQDGNGTVWVPSGTFIPTSTLYINTTHVTLQGQGGKHWGQTGATIFQQGATLSNGMINVTGVGVSIEDIKFYNPNRVTYQGDAITFTDSTSSVVRECGFKSINGSCVYFIDACYSPRVLECDFQGCGSLTHGTIRIGTDITTVKIDECTFHIDYNMTIECESSASAFITNNYFESDCTKPYQGHIYGHFTHAKIIGNNIATYTGNINGYGIYLEGTENTVQGNYIYGTYEGITASNYDGQIISNNFIEHVTHHGISVFHNCTIEGNQLKDIGDDGIVFKDDCLVDDNHLRNITDIALRFLGHRSKASDNIIITANKGISIGFGMINCSACDNQLYDCATSPYDGGTDSIIKDNVGYNYDSLRDDKIWNSNGKYWEVTGANLDTAIADVGDNGWITTPAGKIALSSDVDFNGVDNFTWISYGTELEVIDSTSFDGAGLISIFNCNNLHIEGLELDGNHPWNTSASDAYGGVNIEKCSNSTFNHLHIHHVLGDGIVILDNTESTLDDRNCSNNRFTNNHIHHIGDVYDNSSNGDAGIRIMGSSHMINNVISDNRIDMVREHGIEVYGYTTVSAVKYQIHNGTRIVNNIVSNCNLGHWGDIGDVHGTSIHSTAVNTLVDGNIIYVGHLEAPSISCGSYNIITNNHIIFTADVRGSCYGISAIVNDEMLNPANGVIISDNIIDGHGFANANGIILGSGVENITCTENTIRDVASIGIAATCYHSDISHNHIYNTGSDGINLNYDYNTVSYNDIHYPGDEGISCTGTDHCDISHNNIKNSTERGIEFSTACTWCTVLSNSIVNSVYAGIKFIDEGSYEFFDVSHNHIDAACLYGIRMYDVENSTIAFNIMDRITGTGIYEYSDCHFNIFIGNNAKGANTAWNMNGVGSVNSTNLPAMT